MALEPMDILSTLVDPHVGQCGTLEEGRSTVWMII